MAPIAEDPEEEGEKKIRPLDDDDIKLLKTYGLGPYAESIRSVEQEIKEKAKRVNDLCGTSRSMRAPWELDGTEMKDCSRKDRDLISRCKETHPFETTKGEGGIQSSRRRKTC